MPAGLGVLEAVFVALLAHEVAETRPLAALLAYRALYYLLPLAVALVAYLVTEMRARRLRAHAGNKHNKLLHIARRKRPIGEMTVKNCCTATIFTSQAV